MCKLIAELASADPQVVREMVHRLEHASGAPRIDIRLTGEIYGKLHMKMRELGLDPQDTTPHELYAALVNLAAQHDKFLADRLGIDEYQDPSVVLPTVISVINHWKIQKDVWALKPVAAKRLLKAIPPKNLMKELNYRSLDSLLKRESANILLTVARHIEPATWQQKMLDAYKKLKANDFEVQPVQIAYMEASRWQKLGHATAGARRTNIMHAPETGTILALPMPNIQFRGLTLTSLLLILHWVSELRMHSTYFKFQHMQPSFGKLLSKTLAEQTAHHAHLAGQPIHWRIVHRYYGNANRLDHPEIFEPHVQPEDLAYRKAEAMLFRLEPALHFWHDIDYVGLPQADGQPLSFNLMDVSVNLLNQIPYEHRANYHLRDAVWNELYGRYVGEHALEQQLLQQLDEQFLGDNAMRSDMEFVW